jgi:hypothetical protein
LSDAKASLEGVEECAFGETSAPVAQTGVLPEFAPVPVKFGPAEYSKQAFLG